MRGCGKGTAMRNSPPSYVGSQGLERLIPRDRAPALVRALRSRSNTIVTTNGSFDLLHLGHLRYLKEARAQGDVLIVGLNSDASVRKYKGPLRPIHTELQRAEALLSLRPVDYVVIFGEVVPMPFIELICPDVHVNGAEYGEDCIEAETVARLGGRLHLVARNAGLSSTNLIERILTLHHRPARRHGAPSLYSLPGERP